MVVVSGLLARLVNLAKAFLFPRPELGKKYGIRALVVEINSYEITIMSIIGFGCEKISSRIIIA